jgi:hypothetical protein
MGRRVRQLGSRVKVLIILDGLLLGVRGELPPAGPRQTGANEMLTLWWLVLSAPDELTQLPCSGPRCPGPA